MELTLSKDADLASAQSRAYEMIDQAAGKARARYITTVEGQEATYLLKAADADRYKLDGYPVDTSAYPWVEAEVNATGLTPTEASDAIIAQRDSWLLLAAAIESARIGAKRNISLAITVNTVNQIRRQAISELGNF